MTNARVLGKLLLAFALAIFCVSAKPVFGQETSSLWGTNGERWEPGGRLPDYSYAGYRSGESPIPDTAVSTVITDYGAIANDGIDDSAAIQAAIDATERGAVLVPTGTFQLDQPIVISSSNVVIRGLGDGINESVLFVPQNATERADGVHDMRFSWGLAGFIVLFKGASPTGSYAITQPASRGDRTIRLADAAAFNNNRQLIIMMQDERLYGSLFSHLHNDRLTGWSQGTAQPWCGASDSWAFTVESINGNDVTLKEPLPFDIRPEWIPTAQTGRAITQSGIENLRIRYRYDSAPAHLTERGYNGIRFERVRDSWIRNVTIEDVDNGITIAKQSSRNTLSDIVIEGRRGHHATTITQGSSYNLISNIELNVDNADQEWIHAFTIDHAAQGNVIQRGQSNKVLKLDLHRDSPFENLYTEILTQSNLKGSGDWCAGPHSGARLTLWNAAGVTQNIEADLLKGVDSQVNIVSNTDRTDVKSDDGLWVENIENIKPRNLYEAQLTRRLGADNPEPTVGLISARFNESTVNAVVVAQLSEPSQSDISIGVHTRPGTAVNGADFYGMSQTFVFAPGTTKINIPVTLIDDDRSEPDERFDLRLFSVNGAKVGNAVATLTIAASDQNDGTEISIEDGRVTEGDTHSIKLRLNSPSASPVEVSLATQPGTAVNGQDYYGVYEKVIFAAGETELNVPVNVLDDTQAEPTEAFTQSILSVTGATIKKGRATTTIVDDD